MNEATTYIPDMKLVGFAGFRNEAEDGLDEAWLRLHFGPAFWAGSKQLASFRSRASTGIGIRRTGTELPEVALCRVL